MVGRRRGSGRGGPPVSASRGKTGASSRGRGRTSRFITARQQVDLRHADDLVDWLNTPCSSSSSSSLPQAHTSSESTRHPPTASSSTVTPAVALPSCPQESQELFQHSVGHFHMEDAQDLLCTDEASEEEGSVTVARETGGSPAASQQLDSPAPDPGAHCEVGGSDVEMLGEEDEDRDWVPVGAEEDSEVEGEIQRRPARTSARGRQKRSCLRRSSQQTPVPVAVLSPPSAGTSAVWAFFQTSAADRTIAVCNVCRKQVKRGTNPNHLGTTCMIRHMKTQHASRWALHDKGTVSKKAHASASASASAAAPTPPSSRPLFSSSSSSTVQHALSAASAVRDADDSGASTPSSSVQSSWQITLPQLVERKRQYAATHPHARQLNACLAKGLAVSLLPFSLVEDAWFQEFAHIAVPRWTVPSRHYFARQAVPSLHRHIQSKIEASLKNSLSSRVHLTADTWSSKHGQGRYISITAHWVTLLATGTDARQGSVLELVAPPRLCTAGGEAAAPIITSTPSSSSSSSSSMTSPLPLKPTRGYATSQVKRCHAVLKLVCVGAKSHTGQELRSAILGQCQSWLTPRQLQPGMVVCDNGTNLLAALRLAQLMHVPCLAHVLNLVVQRFLLQFPGLQAVLKKARKVVSHFRRSYTATARLAALQRECNLPPHRLICDMPTRWNSTLAMLQRLNGQQRAVTQYLLEYANKTGSGSLGFFLPDQWLLMQDVCTVLSPFEEATKMVSRDSACISDTIPLVFLLEHTLRGIMDKGLEAEQAAAAADYYASGEPLFPDSPVETRQSAVEEEAEEEEEEEDEEEEDSGPRGRVGDLGESGMLSPGLVRGWREPLEDTVVIDDEHTGEPTSRALSNLRRMGNLMTQSLRKDPRVRKVKAQDEYWLASLLDPRYKARVADFLPQYQRQERLKRLGDILKAKLLSAYPDSPAPAQESSGMRAEDEGRVSGGPSLHAAFQTFFSPPSPGLSTSPNHRQRLHQMVDRYLGETPDPTPYTDGDALAFWGMRLDTFPELAQYAVELLSCPAASVLSERTFSAAGGVVTEKRVRLSTDSVDRLTFIKMNQSWISRSYQGPDADVAD